MQDCHFVPHGPPRLVSCQQKVLVNIVSASTADKSLAHPHGEALDRQQPHAETATPPTMARDIEAQTAPQHA